MNTVKTQPSTELFAGRLLPLGGLSNERELAKACPYKFKKDNHWTRYVTLFPNKGSVDTANWKWKSDDTMERSHQLKCLYGVLKALGLWPEDKLAVASWMLSEMLSEVPVYLPRKKN